MGILAAIRPAVLPDDRLVAGIDTGVYFLGLNPRI